MPLLEDKVTTLVCQGFCPAELLDLEAEGLPELDILPDDEDGFTIALSHVHVDGKMIVAVEEESEAVLCEHGWHLFGRYAW
jgi:hypothetical protein